MNSLILGVEEGGIVILLIKLHIYLFNNIWNEKKNNFPWAPTMCPELYKALELQRWVREEFFPKEHIKEQVADTDTEKQAKRKRSNLRQLGLLEGLPKGEDMWPGLKGWVEFSQGRRVLELLRGNAENAQRSRGWRRKCNSRWFSLAGKLSQWRDVGKGRMT